jgi:type I restriction enzyme M protein
VPKTTLNADEHARNNLPDVLARWVGRDASERERPRTEQSFCVTKTDLVGHGYDLSLNRYKEIVHAPVDHRPPSELLADLATLETEIQHGMQELEKLLA